jgi:hypothetical protein
MTLRELAMKTNRHAFKLTAIASSCLLSFSAHALSLQYEGFNFGLDNKLSISAMMRVASRDPNLIGIANGGNAYSTNKDDGNLLYDKGDLTSSEVKLTSELTISKGDFGIFARGTAFGGNLIDSRDRFNIKNYGVGKEAPVSEYYAKNRAVSDHNDAGVDWLDTYFYGSFPVLSRSVAFKIGRHSLNWGESTFVLNGINSMLAFDANRARSPDFALNEVIIPAAMASVAFNVTDKVSVETFYQLKWEKTVIDASGTFFSTNDFAGIGGTRANIGFGRAPENTPGTSVQRAPDRTPRDMGQYGVAMHYFANWLNDTDLGLYAMNYHSRLPVYSGISTNVPLTVGNASYFAEFPENIHLYGASFNTALPLGFALQGEYSFKQGQPIQIDTVELLLAGLGAPSQFNPIPGGTAGNQYLRGWRRKDISQVDFGTTKLFGPSTWLGWSQVLVLGEVAYMHVHNLEDTSVLRYDGPATDTPGNAATAAAQGVPQQDASGYATADSWGYNFLARATYNNVLNLFTLEPTLRFIHDVYGISPKPVNNFVEGRKQATISLGMRFRNEVSTSIGYTNFFGGGNKNLLSDHDFVDATIKYSF